MTCAHRLGHTTLTVSSALPLLPTSKVQQHLFSLPSACSWICWKCCVAQTCVLQLTCQLGWLCVGKPPSPTASNRWMTGGLQSTSGASLIHHHIQPQIQQVWAAKPAPVENPDPRNGHGGPQSASTTQSSAPQFPLKSYKHAWSRCRTLLWASFSLHRCHFLLLC